MKRKRYSRQRELILEQLQGTWEHPTAEMIYQWLKPDYPALSLGTVYRNLKQLSEEGIIKRMPFPVERYDANTMPHPHFVCQACGGVYDMEMPYDQQLDERAKAASRHQIEGHELLFNGTCASCREKVLQ